MCIRVSESANLSGVAALPTLLQFLCKWAGVLYDDNPKDEATVRIRPAFRSALIQEILLVTAHL